jgi:SAM domain (Sterile alpha motif)/AAA ATPase domain
MAQRKKRGRSWGHLDEARRIAANIAKQRAGGVAIPSCGQQDRRAWSARPRRVDGPGKAAFPSAMQQVSDWLEELGLGQYAERFAEHDISFAVLPDLSDQASKKIGVASLGHRRHGRDFWRPPNVAARAQALAEPGAVVVTARVQRQVAGLFVAEDRGSHELKGVPEPVALYRIVRASGGGRRSGQRQLTSLVGRDEEMAMLMRRWDRARQGDGQFVLIAGEPGLGKSRLLEEFHNRLRDTPHTWTEWSFLQLLQNTPLHSSRAGVTPEMISNRQTR